MNVVLHSSDSSFGNAALITKWHVKERGWKNIGYHYVILNGRLSKNLVNKSFDGHIETGRPLDDDSVLEWDEIGAHVKGWNQRAIGICLIGKSGSYTRKQLAALVLLLAGLKEQFNSLNIYQHSDLDPKKPHCAGIDLYLLKQLLLSKDFNSLIL